MTRDKLFYGTILALFIAFFGYPGWAAFVFILAMIG